jgi:hypothetical protein
MILTHPNSSGYIWTPNIRRKKDQQPTKTTTLSLSQPPFLQGKLMNALYISIIKVFRLGKVTQTCNPTYSKGRDWGGGGW